jgi:hypothetical protein
LLSVPRSAQVTSGTQNMLNASDPSGCPGPATISRPDRGCWSRSAGWAGSRAASAVRE